MELILKTNALICKIHDAILHDEHHWAILTSVELDRTESYDFYRNVSDWIEQGAVKKVGFWFFSRYYINLPSIPLVEIIPTPEEDHYY